MQPKIVKFGPVKIAGYLHKTSMDNNTIPAFWGEIMSDGRHEKLHGADFAKQPAEHGAEYGVCFMLNDNDMDYVIGAEVKPGAQVSDDFYACEIPAGDYAVFSVEPYPLGQPSTNIQTAWGVAFDWLATSEYAVNNNPSFEIYFPGCTCGTDAECAACNSGNMICDIYIGVDKK